MTLPADAGRRSPGAPAIHVRALDRWVEDPRLAYATILALQLKVVWGMWGRRDLTIGDTASYFTYAWSWYDHLGDFVCWSPLYTAFYGSLLHFTTDAYAVTILSRLLIVLGNAALVLALMRRLLPPAIAWLAAAWWVIVPIHYDAIYEVHLFALVPVLAGALAILSGDGPRARGAALGILLATSFLMRNELGIATALLGALMLVAEAREFRRIESGARRRWIVTRAGAYGLPLLAAVGLLVFFYQRSDVRFPLLSEATARKHTLNVCQIYAFSYKQRRSDWNKSEWTECQDLMRRDFGSEEPSMSEAIRANPRAMLEHFAWNTSRFPVGLQTVLFDVTSGKINPEYAPYRPAIAIALSAALGALLAGGAALWRRRALWNDWLRARAWGWAYLLAVDCTVLFVMVMQRPRPNYMFTLAISIIAAAGTAFFALVPRRLARHLPVLAAVAALVLFAATPTYFNRSQGRVIAGRSRPLLVAYRRLAPFADRFTRSEAFLAPYDASELCLYLGRRLSHTCNGVLYDALANRPLDAALDEQHVGLVYADDAFPLGRELTARAGDPRWRIVGSGRDADGSWALLERAG